MINSSSDSSPFTLLSVAPAYLLDWDVVNSNLRSLQETLHPDRYPPGSHEYEIAKSMMSAINNAYRILKDPLLRAHALFELSNIMTPGSDAHTITDSTIMEEALELKESLAKAESPAELTALIKVLAAQQSMLEKKLDEAFKTSNEANMCNTYASLSFCVKTQTDAHRLITKKNED